MKLKSIIFSAFFVNSMIVISCSSQPQADIDTTLPQFSIEKSTPAPSPNIQKDSGQLITNTDPSANIVAYNPPHGQPGHDCSIAVGAPLNTPGVTPVQNSMNAQARLNPPHGQPGHLCEIPVGQPLP